jgi:predicted outer membrane repeat protein
MAILTVSTTANSGAGSLREAIASARSGDTIQFAASLANQTITLNSQIAIDVGKNLIIDGAGATNLTISGNNASRIFQLNSNSATPTRLTVKNLTLANGYTAEQGGAINTTHQGALTIENVSFNNNVADKGGGAIFSAFEGSLTVTNSRFDGNKAIAGNDEWRDHDPQQRIHQ